MAKAKSFGRAVVPVLLLPLGLAPLAAHALGLGTLRVNSALGQRLNASIELIGATPAEAELAAISLASAEAHQRMGIDSSLGGVMLRFAVKVGSDGRSYVQVSSGEPVREPYIDFVVEAISPTGQVVRHYTILLDPVGAPPAASPAAAWSSAVTPIPEQDAPRPRSNQFAGGVAPKAGAVFGPVPPGATLWAIARRVQPAGVGLDAVMSTIVRANPQAFINGNPDLLRAGSRLTIPDAQVLRAELVTEAPPAVEAPTEDAPAAASPPASEPLPTEASGAVEAVPAAPEAGAEVRVLRTEDAQATPVPVAQSADVGADGNRIQLLEEALDAAQQHNESLQQRMGSLEEQIRTLAELVKANPVDNAAGSGPAQSPAPAVADPASTQTPTAPVAPAVATPVAPAPPVAAQAGGGPLVYLMAAVAGLGLGGLLLWARRRKAMPTAATDGGGPSQAAMSIAAMAGAVTSPASNVAWVEPAVVQPVPINAPADVQIDDGFGDPVDTQIDLLTAYVGMADGASARQIHDEIQRVGTAAQKAQAAALLARLDG